MKVLYFAREYPPFEVGGVAKHTFHLVKAMKKLGVKCTVLSFGDSTCSNEEIKYLDPRSSVSSKIESPIRKDVIIPLDILRITKVANRLLRNENFDILHVQEPYIGAYVSHPRKVTTIHDTSYGETKPLLPQWKDFAVLKRILFYASFGYFSEQISALTSKRLIVPFSHIKEELSRAYGVSAKKVSVIHNGVELPQLPSILEKKRAKEQLGLSVNHTLIFTAAHHIPRKRIETLVEAVGLLKRDKKKNFLVFIAGDGPSKNSIENLIKNLGLTDVVKTLGWISEQQLALAFKASDIFVMTSEYEAGPISLLEAMAYGDSVVSSNISGFPCLIKNREEGLLFPVGDSSSLCSHLEFLLDNEGKRVAMSLKGRRFAERFNWDDVAMRTLELYRSL